MSANKYLIEQLRKRQGEMTQQEFAEMLGVSQSQLSRLLSGKRGIGPKTLDALMERCPDLFLPGNIRIGMAVYELASEDQQRPGG